MEKRNINTDIFNAQKLEAKNIVLYGKGQIMTDIRKEIEICPKFVETRWFIGFIIIRWVFGKMSNIQKSKIVQKVYAELGDINFIDPLRRILNLLYYLICRNEQNQKGYNS
ncbi:MAG: hypothetical protein EZS28_016942 [Streblomastix strix]|uniref:Uncharacterized protein n=1 Tax=Streblomastix strix TaxID=222440 RepID=A0A5J4VY10_9EUKA|nr:MAG: hypothetical protein EZS28_016942 [Streblomastix strix]